MSELFRMLGIATRDCEGNQRAFCDVMNDLMEACGMESKPGPLLTIELENETAVPKVFYKGEEVSDKIHINFDWTTKDFYSPGGLTYGIEKLCEDGAVEKMERRLKDHR